MNSRLSFAGAFGSCAIAMSAAAVPTYTVVDLGTLGGTSSTPICCQITKPLNGSGQVTGYSTTSGGQQHAFLWNGSSMQDLGTLGGTTSFGYGVNSSGQVAGYSYTSGNVQQRAFLWNGSSMQNLGTLGGNGSVGLGINNGGQVTGYSYVPDGTYQAFFWNGSSMQNLGTLGGSYSLGYAINGSGDIVGSAGTLAGAAHAFFWNGSSMQDLGTLAGGASYGLEINDAGIVAGSSDVAGGGHAFVYDGTSMTDLNLGGSYSAPYDLNATGEVVGYSYLSGNSQYHAFLWNGTSIQDLGALAGSYSEALGLNDLGDAVGISAGVATLWSGGSLYDLNTLVTPGSGFTIEQAYDINDAGQIAAYGCSTSTAQCHALLLDPLNGVAEPGTLASLGLGLIGLGIVRRKRRAFVRKTSALRGIFAAVAASTALIASTVDIVIATPFTGPTSSYYLDNYDTSTMYIVQGPFVTGSFPLTAYGGNANYYQGSFAVDSTVRTHGFFAPSGGQLAGEYTLGGTPTGNGYDSFPALTGYQNQNAYDGTTDGVHNYYVQYFANTPSGSVFENVVQTDLDWQNPAVLFSVQSSANQCCEFLGITYDPTNSSLWISGWVSTDIRDYSLGGTLLSSFSTGHGSNGALAYDAADNSLWISDGESSFLEQYSTSGTLLQGGTPTGLPNGDYLAGEFALKASVPEPATVGLLALGLSAAGFARRRPIHG